ncbi:MAG: hypothetical protein ACLR4Z_17815 [Butyricicoccaceae bacterium]
MNIAAERDLVFVAVVLAWLFLAKITLHCKRGKQSTDGLLGLSGFMSALDAEHRGGIFIIADLGKVGRHFQYLT